MASGPTIPIYIDVSTSANKALKDYNKFLSKVSDATTAMEAKYSNLQKSGLMGGDAFNKFTMQLGDIKGRMALTAKTSSQLKQRIQDLEWTLRNSNPNTKTWEKQRAKLEEARKEYARLERQIGRTNTGNASRGFNNMAASMRASRKEALLLNNVFINQSSYVTRLVERMLLYFGLRQAVSFLRKIRDVTKEFELQRVALGALVQNIAEGNLLFERIKKAAVKSPFQVKDLVTYTKQLSAYRIETKDLFGTMNRLADLSAGLGTDMGRLILAYGQVKSASVLRGQEMRQFTEAGIPLVQALADKFTELKGRVVSTAEVFDLVSKRAVSFEMVKEVIDDMTSAGGQFYNMQEKQAETLAGRWSNLKDTISIMYDEMGRTGTVQKELNNIIDATKWLAKNWQTVGRVLTGSSLALILWANTAKNASITSKSMTFSAAAHAAIENKRTIKLNALTTAMVGNTAATNYSRWATKLHTASQVRAAMATTGFSRAFWGLNAAMAANPIGAILTGLTLLITGIVAVSKHFNKVKDDAEKARDFAVQLQDVVDKYLNTKKNSESAIKVYERLMNKTKLTMSESMQLTQVTDLLIGMYGKEAEALRDVNVPLEEKLELLRRLSAAQNEENRNNANNQIEEANKELENARAARDEAQAQLEYMQAHPHKVLAMGQGGLVTTGYTKDQVNTQKALVKELDEAFQELWQSQLDAIEKLKGDANATEDTLTAWRKKVKELQGDTNLFDDGQLSGFETLRKALEDTAKEYKKYKEQVDSNTKAIEDKKNATDAETKAIVENLKEENKLSDARMQAAYAILEYFNALDLLKKKNGSGRSATDMFVDRMKAEADFYKDYKKNVEDFNKYMEGQKSKEQTQTVMKARAAELGIDMTDLNGDIDMYKEKMEKLIADTKKEIKKAGKITGEPTLEKLMGITTTNTKLKSLINTLKTLYNDLTTAVAKDWETKMDAAIKATEQKVKSARVANEMYEKLSGITGNRDLASRITVAIYGEDGKGLQETISEQLRQAFEQGSADMDKVNVLIKTKDWSGLTDMLDTIPEKYRSIATSILEAQQKLDADWISNLLKTYEKAKDFAQQRIDIEEQAKKDIEDLYKNMDKTGMSTDELETQEKAINNKKQQKLAAVDVEELKASDLYQEAFGDIERIGKTTLELLKDEVQKLQAAWAEAGQEAKDSLSPESAKALEEIITKITDQLETRNPFMTFNSGVANYVKGLNEMVKLRNERKKLTKGTEEYKKKTEELRKAESKYRTGLKQMQKGVSGLSDQFNNLSSAVTQFITLFNTIRETFVNVEEYDDMATVLESIGTALSIIGTALVFVNAMVTLLESHPLIIAAMAVTAALVAIVTALSNLKTNKANREIKAQEEAIEKLEKAYERLNEDIEKAFGSDYISDYTQQMEILEAKATAVQKKIEAERSKGKKASQDDINDLQNEYNEVIDEIRQKQTELSEHFSGTDLASAAKSFAESWIEAYKEFSNTTDAMKEKFQETIQNMIVESLAAKAMQTLLQPIFDQIDELAGDGELDAADISAIYDQATQSIPAINDSMTSLMNQLASAGYNVRNQASGLTGISKDIATASEESILGLAAGINTQNFYIAQTNDYVFQILTILQSGAMAAVGGAAIAPTGENYLASLPTIAGHTASILTQCEAMVAQCQAIAEDVHRVVQPRGTTGTHWVVTN